MKNLNRIDQMTIKENNKQNLLNAFSSEDYQMVSDLILKTGLTSVTTNSILKELVEEGWIDKSHYGESSGGRKPMVYKFNQEKAYVMQVSISKNFIYLIVTDLRKNKIIEYSKKTKIRGNEELEIEIQNLLVNKEIGKIKDKLIAIAVTIPGIIDTEKSKVLYSSPLKVRDFDFIDFFEKHGITQLPVYVFKRVDGLLMEYIGSNLKNQKTAYILIDDGIGLSVNEWGHGLMTVRAGNELGHVVVRTSQGTEILGDTFRNDRIYDMYKALYPHTEVYDAKELKSMLKEKGEGDREKFIEELENQLAIIGANVVNLLAPEKLVIGGGFSEFISEKQIQSKMKDYVLEPFADNLEVDISSISYDKLIEGTINYILFNHVFIATQ